MCTHVLIFLLTSTFVGIIVVDVNQQKMVEPIAPRRVLRLRQLRRQREMTQAELANKVGLTTGSISAIESGSVKPSFDTALALAAVFGRPVEELFEYVEVPA